MTTEQEYPSQPQITPDLDSDIDPERAPWDEPRDPDNSNSFQQRVRNFASQPSPLQMNNSGPERLSRSQDLPGVSGPQLNPVVLAPIDQQVLELTGDLPNLPLLLNPKIRERLRTKPLSVHIIETTGKKRTNRMCRTSRASMDDIPPEFQDRQDYSYRGYLLRPRMDAYLRAVEIYGIADGSFGGKLSSRLQVCRKQAWFMQHKVTKKLRVMSSRCKLRWCPICRDVSRMIVTGATDEWLKIQKYPKMITLTLKHSDDPLQLQIRRLYDCFRKLRRRAYFQRLVTGGIWFFQVKLNPSTEQWHPHIHCLVAGKYLPHARLKQLWHTITSDSNIVDIRPVRDLEAASTEVARYATSPADITKVDIDHAMEIYDATKGRNICGSWGTAKKIKLRPQPMEDTGDWEKVADFFFINVSKEFNEISQAFWRCFKKDIPYEGPEVQSLSEVYADEIDALAGMDDAPLDYWQFRKRVEAISYRRKLDALQTSEEVE